jgi:hypothetical protein
MMWLNFQWAAEEVERRLGVSWGAAQNALLKACKNGTVKWQRAEHGGPDVLDIDFERWLEAKQSPRKATSRKRALAKQAVNDLWPGGVPKDKDLLNKQIEKEVDNWITAHCKQANLSKLEVSGDTILRAAGRKK